MKKRTLVINTPNRGTVYLLPLEDSPLVKVFYFYLWDPAERNVAARYVVAEGWVQYAAGTICTYNDGNGMPVGQISIQDFQNVNQLIESI